MEGSVGYLFAIVFLVIVVNLYIVFGRMGRRDRRRKKRSQPAADEVKQALWRDREIERRLEREQDGAMERVKLREETLALYDEVRRRHAEKDKLEGLGFSASGDGFLSSYGERKELEETELDDLGLESHGLDSAGLDNPELYSYLTESEPVETEKESKVELIEMDLKYTNDDSDDSELDPFEIFRKKKK